MRKPLLPLFIRAQAELTASVSRVVDIIEAMGLECYPPQYSWYGGRGADSYFLQVLKRDGVWDAWTYIAGTEDRPHSEWVQYQNLPAELQVMAAVELGKIVQEVQQQTREIIDQMRSHTLSLETAADMLRNPTSPEPPASLEELL